MEFRMLTGDLSTGTFMLMANLGKNVEMFKAPDVDSALAALSVKGWKRFAGANPIHTDCRIVVARPKQ